MKDDTNKDYRQRGSDSGLHNKKNLHRSTENKITRSHLGDTTRAPGSQRGPQHESPRFRPGQQHQICALRRSTLLHSWHGMPPIDSLLHWTLHDSESREKNFGKQRACLEHQHRQERQRGTRATAEQTREDTTNKYSIAIHIRIDNNREDCISEHFRMDGNHEYCISIHLRICWRSTRYFQSMNRQRSSQYVEDRTLSECNMIQHNYHREFVRGGRGV